MRREVELVTKGRYAALGEVDVRSAPSDFSCPDRHGTLVELDAEHKRWTGLARTAEALPAAQAVSQAKALWPAPRSPEEKVGVAERTAGEAGVRRGGALVDRCRSTEEEARDAADVLRGHLLTGAFGRQ